MEGQRLSMLEAAAEAANLPELGEPVIVDSGNLYQAVKPEPSAIQVAQASPPPTEISKLDPRLNTRPRERTLTADSSTNPYFSHSTATPVGHDRSEPPRKSPNEATTFSGPTFKKSASTAQSATLHQRARTGHGKGHHASHHQTNASSDIRKQAFLSTSSVVPTSRAQQSDRTLEAHSVASRQAFGNLSSYRSETAVQPRLIHTKQETIISASGTEIHDNLRKRASQTIQTSRSTLVRPLGPSQSNSTKRPRSSPETNEILDEPVRRIRRQRTEQTTAISAIHKKHHTPSGNVVSNVPATATEPYGSSGNGADTAHNQIPHTTSSTSPCSQAVGQHIRKPFPEAPPLPNDVRHEHTAVTSAPKRSKQRFLQPFQPTASSRKHPAPPKPQTVRTVPNPQPVWLAGSSNLMPVRVPLSVPVHEYQQTQATGWRHRPPIIPQPRVNEFDYPRVDGYSMMREIHARSQQQISEPQRLTSYDSRTPALTTSSIQNRDANLSLAKDRSCPSVQQDRGQSTGVAMPARERHDCQGNVNPSEGEAHGNLIELYGPQIDPKRDPDLQRVLDDNRTTLLGFLRRYALLLVDPGDDDESTWVACKFCPTFHCKTRQPNYIMMLVTPFGVNKIVAHHRREHARTWEEYSACGDTEKDRFFEKFEMPARGVFLNRLLELRPGWERCGKKKTMTGKPQLTRFNLKNVTKAMAATAVEKGSLERFQVTLSADGESSESEGMHEVLKQDPRIPTNVSEEEVCIGRRKAVETYLQDDPQKERARFRFMGRNYVTRDSLIAHGLIRANGERRKWFYDRAADIILTGALSDKDIRPASAKMGWFCPSYFPSEDGLSNTGPKDYKAKLKVMAVVLFYLARGIPLDIVSEMALQGRNIARGFELEQQRRYKLETLEARNGKLVTTEPSGEEKYVESETEDVKGKGTGAYTGEQCGIPLRNVSLEMGVEEGFGLLMGKESTVPDAMRSYSGGGKGASQGLKEESLEECMDDIRKSPEILPEGNKRENEGIFTDEAVKPEQGDPSSGSIGPGLDDEEESEAIVDEDEEWNPESCSDIEERMMDEKWMTETNIWNCGNSICAEGMRIFREKFNDARFQYGRRGNKGFVLGTRRCEEVGVGGLEIVGTVQVANGTWMWMHILSIGEGEDEVMELKRMLDCLVGNWRLRILGLKSGISGKDTRAKEVERKIVEMLKEEGVGKWFQYLENGKVLNFNVEGMEALEVLQLLEEYGEWFAKEYDDDEVIVNEYCTREVKAECEKLTVMWRMGNSKMNKMKNMRVATNLMRLLNRLWGLKLSGKREKRQWREEHHVAGGVNVLLERVLWARNVETFLAEMNPTYRWSRRKGVPFKI